MLISPKVKMGGINCTLFESDLENWLEKVHYSVRCCVLGLLEKVNLVFKQLSYALLFKPGKCLTIMSATFILWY